MDDTESRKNYGGRMIFGDEKLTPLRSVPRCALPSVGSFNLRLSGSLRCARSAQIPLRGTSDSPTR